MKSLIHNGIIVLQPPDFPDFNLTIRGDFVSLNPLQSEMAVAWVNKLGTPYVEDHVFLKDARKTWFFSPILANRSSVSKRKVWMAALVANRYRWWRGVCIIAFHISPFTL